MVYELDSSYITERDLVTRLLGACVSQTNWYTSNQEEMYFMARHEVLMELSSQMVEYYKAERGTSAGAARRDENYVTFYQWLKSEEFTNSVGPQFIFTDPYIVGSSWTPLRKDNSAIDICISIRGQTEDFHVVPSSARELFIRAFCEKFAVNEMDEVIVKNNTISFNRAGFNIFCIHLVQSSNQPPPAALLTAAINQYDDFLKHFSVLAFFIQNWFKEVRKAGRGTEKLAVPSSHSIYCLLIHFLQFYELVPHFFINTPSSNGSFLLGYKMQDIVSYKLAAYHPNMYQHYKDFERIRQDRAPNIGEILTMFFFFYGYIIDLPHRTITMQLTEIHDKLDIECIALSLHEKGEFSGSEVPDAYRLQFLFREAFQTIKDAQNPYMVSERLLRMRLDESFNSIRDRIMKENPKSSQILQEAYQDTDEYFRNPQNHRNVGEINGLFVTECGKIRQFQRKKDKSKHNLGGPTPDLQFSDEFHAMKTFFRRPYIPKSGLTSATLSQLNARAERMFMTTVLPNPNDNSELSVIFRPPNSRKNRLLPIDDNAMESAFPDFRLNVEPEPVFFDLVKMACYRELEEMKTVRKMHSIARQQRKIQENKENLEEPIKAEPSLTVGRRASRNDRNLRKKTKPTKEQISDSGLGGSSSKGEPSEDNMIAPSVGGKPVLDPSGNPKVVATSEGENPPGTVALKTSTGIASETLTVASHKKPTETSPKSSMETSPKIPTVTTSEKTTGTTSTKATGTPSKTSPETLPKTPTVTTSKTPPETVSKKTSNDVSKRLNVTPPKAGPKKSSDTSPEAKSEQMAENADENNGSDVGFNDDADEFRSQTADELLRTIKPLVSHEADIRNGTARVFTYVLHLRSLKESWIDQAKTMIVQDVAYSRLNTY